MRSLLIALLIWMSGPVLGFPADTTKLLIADMIVQIEATEALDAMYNFDFKESEKQFNWLRQKHPHHPLPYFVMGLNEWCKIMPEVRLKTI